MKTMWKNVLGVVLVAAISTGAAVGTSAYLMNKNQPVYVTDFTNTFNQPVRYAGLNAVAAENTDFTQAAESTVHGVVHIKAKPMPSSMPMMAEDSNMSILLSTSSDLEEEAEEVFSVRNRSLVSDLVQVLLFPQMDILSQITM